MKLDASAEESQSESELLASSSHLGTFPSFHLRLQKDDQSSSAISEGTALAPLAFWLGHCYWHGDVSEGGLAIPALSCYMPAIIPHLHLKSCNDSQEQRVEWWGPVAWRWWGELRDVKFIGTNDKISCGDLMHSIVIIVNNTVLPTSKLRE